jgi:hypothetical protein
MGLEVLQKSGEFHGEENMKILIESNLKKQKENLLYFPRKKLLNIFWSRKIS